MGTFHDFEVRIGWGTAATAADEVLILDDATYGKLNNNVLGLPYGTQHIPADLTSFCRMFTWSRGRRNEFEEPRAGSVTVDLIDTSGELDPLNTSSSYNVTMGAPIQVTHGADPVGEFMVTDVQMRHVTGHVGRTELGVHGVDRLGTLAVDLDTIASSHDGDTTGTRIGRVLDASEVNWSGTRAIDTGQSTLIATTFGGSALGHILDCVRSERGLLFIDKAGAFTFRNRHSNPNAAVQFGFEGDATPSAFSALSSDQTANYSGLGQASLGETFWNRAKVTDGDGNEYTASDADSISDTGVTRTKTLSTLLDDATTAQEIADDVVARFADQSASAFDSITLKPRNLNSATLANLIGLEIGDVVYVGYRDGSGYQRMLIEGISGAVTVEDVEMTFWLSRFDFARVFVLDHPQWGVLADTSGGAPVAGGNRLSF